MKDVLYPLRVLHGRVHDWRTNRLSLLRERLHNPEAIYLLNTPEHGNLGDHAIAVAEIEFLNELGIPYIEYTDQKLNILRDNKSLNVMNGRPILIHGGGNLGMLWPSVEVMMQNIVQQNPKSKIIFLPNTIFYTDTEEDRDKLKHSMSIYNSHPGLEFFARETTSYEMMSAVYDHVGIAPDMVLRMNKCKTGVERKGCILCLREDREKTVSPEEKEIIYTQVHSIFGDSVRLLDMVRPYPIPAENREQELEAQFDAFRHAELVVTDRLHGMIFSAITGTPCIVIDSKSPKVRGCYEWIKDLSYIRFCDHASQIGELYSSIPKQEWLYDNSKLTPLYEPLIEAIQKTVRGR